MNLSARSVEELYEPTSGSLTRQQLLSDLSGLLQSKPEPQLIAPGYRLTQLRIDEIMQFIQGGAMFSISRRYLQAIIRELEVDSRR